MRIRWRNFELPSKVMPDKDILNMNYYVEGVEGQLPKK